MTEITRTTRSIALVFACATLLGACATGGETRERKGISDGDLKQASQVNVQLAVGYIQREQYRVAKEKLHKAIDQDEYNIEAYKTMAFLMGIINEPEEAEDYYQEALAINEDDPEIHNSYGAFLCQQGRGEEAQQAFKRAYDNPFYKTKYLAYSNAGTCLIEMERYKQAEALLRKALQSQPKHASTLLSMAEVGIKAKKYLMSRAYIQRFHADNRPSAGSLYLQMQAEKALGAQDHYVKAAKKLLELFPDSAEAGEVEESVRYERAR